MYKFLHPSLTVFVAILFLNANSQQPVLVVQNFDYIWQRDFAAMSEYNLPRIVIATTDTAKHLITNSFTKAIQQRWNAQFPDLSLSVKPLAYLSNTPKFKTKLKDKQPGKWYMFLQVYDEGNPYSYIDSIATILQLNCRIINGTNDSTVFDNTLTVTIYRQQASPDDVVLTRLAAYPAYFTAAFDSIATWLVCRSICTRPV